MTREIVEGYGGVRAMLDRRRNVEDVQAARQRVINRLMMRGFGPCGYPTGPTIEKVPGEDEYVFAPRGTNNPEGARQQQIDGHLEAQKKHLEENNALIRDVDGLIMQLRDAKDQAIMIDYYCNGLWDTQIAREHHFDRTTVWKRRDGAIRELEEKFHVSQRCAT